MGDAERVESTLFLDDRGDRFLLLSLDIGIGRVGFRWVPEESDPSLLGAGEALLSVLTALGLGLSSLTGILPPDESSDIIPLEPEGILELVCESSFNGPGREPLVEPSVTDERLGFFAVVETGVLVGAHVPVVAFLGLKASISWLYCSSSIGAGALGSWFFPWLMLVDMARLLLVLECT